MKSALSFLGHLPVSFHFLRLQLPVRLLQLIRQQLQVPRQLIIRLELL